MPGNARLISEDARECLRMPGIPSDVNNYNC